MKKIIASLALSAAMAGITAGAQAQTVSSQTSGLYSLTASLQTPPPSGTAGTLYPVLVGLGEVGATQTVYQYNYTFTVSGITSGYHVDNLNFTGIQGYLLGSAAVTSAGGTGFAADGTGLPVFTAPTTAGLSTVGQSVTVQLASTVGLGGGTPVTVSTNADITPPNNTNRAGSGQLPGPGPAVPEAGSFAMIGLGLLPIGLVARRRISRRA